VSIIVKEEGKMKTINYCRYCSILLFIFVISGCASNNEFLMGGFDPTEWTVGHQFEDQNQRVIEFVQSGESINSWTELVTYQVYKKPSNLEPIDAFVVRMHADDAKACPNGFVQNVIAFGVQTEIEEASIIYEWKFQKCPLHADQHEVARIIYGKFSVFRLAYVAKTERLAPEKRERWIKNLKEARIIVN
jgi:hypothetical protein